MPVAAVTFVNIVLAASVAGAMFCIWLGFDPAPLSAGAYVEQQHQAIRALNVTVPVLGALTALLTIASALLARRNAPQFAIYMVALLCFLAAGLITRFANQPINAIVVTWSALAPPANWMELRDRWWHWHVLRTGFGVVGFCLLVAASLMNRSLPAAIGRPDRGSLS